MPDAVLFELEGVLAETSGLRAAALRSAFAVGEVPPHEAVEAEGYVPSLDAITADALDRLLLAAGPLR